MLLVYTETWRVSGGLAGPFAAVWSIGRAPKRRCRVYWFLVKGTAVLLVRSANVIATGSTDLKIHGQRLICRESGSE